MIHIPAPVLHYIYSHTIENRAPAYLLIDKDGCLSDWGGKLSAYGVRNLQKGEYVGEKVLFLEGIFPLNGSDLFLPCIKTENGCCADIHIFSVDEGDWVLLLDATWEENQHRLLQQKGNDLSLLREKHAKLLNQHMGNDVAEHLLQKLFGLQAIGERRDVTILFADICGFTNYSEHNPPEVVVKTLNSYISCAIQPIIDEAGMVDKIVGDALTAYFGLLPSTESPGRQAVKAALGIVEAIGNVGKAQQGSDESILHMGIGIASGPTVLGIIGSKDRRTFSAIGYYVKLAAYLKSQARPSEILIDENTFNKIDGLQKEFSLSNLVLKTALEPIRTYSCLVKP